MIHKYSISFLNAFKICYFEYNNIIITCEKLIVFYYFLRLSLLNFSNKVQKRENKTIR